MWQNLPVQEQSLPQERGTWWAPFGSSGTSWAPLEQCRCCCGQETMSPCLLLLLPFTCIGVDAFLIIFWSLFGWRGINHIWIICCFRSFIVQHLFFSKPRHCVIWPKPGGNHMLPCHFYVLPNLLQWSAFKARLSVWLAGWQKSCADHLLEAWLVVKCQGVVILTCKFLKHVQ